jgi:ribonuclease T1
VRRRWPSRSTAARGRLWVGLVAVLAVALLSWALSQGGSSGGGGRPDSADIPRVALSSLPAEAVHTVALIKAGGPFPYDRDGVVFENREGSLPDEAGSYYHEYTVPTPGARDRGARRIIEGSGGELYWTDDHYRTFERISP